MEVLQKDVPMSEEGIAVTQEQVDLIKQRGYNQDLLPKTANKRNMGTINYFTLWMGSVHNIPNYAAVGGFLFLGLSPLSIALAVIVSSLAVASIMVFNGKAGAKYGIPFSMHLRSTYGDVGAKLPGFLRGGIVAIAWFGLQNYTGSLALLILIGKFWPGFLTLGGDFNFLGIGVPGLITFTGFWAINLLIGIGGGAILNKFTAILNPLIYVVFIGMTIWAIKVGGGIGNILSFKPEANQFQANSPILVCLMIVNSVLAVWAGPGSSVSDFTQNAKSTKSERVGQSVGLIVGYTIFAFSSIFILIGGSIYYDVQEWNVLNIVDRWESIPAMLLASIVLLMTTISTNATGNIVPAAYQLSALFPKTINYKKGVIIASIVSYIILPWKLMENSSSIYFFLNLIGATLGPVIGVMLAQYYFVLKENLDLEKLYMDKNADNTNNPYHGINKEAYVATIVALILSLTGTFIPSLEVISDLSFIIGAGISFTLYLVLKKFKI